MKTVFASTLSALLLLLISCSDEKMSLPCSCPVHIGYVDSLSNEFLFIPNIFSPNGDSINDTFFVYGQGIDSFNLQMIDFGRVVFETQDLHKGWDGLVRSSTFTIQTNCETYNMMIDVKFASGFESHYESSVIRFLNDGTSCPKNISDCVFSDQFDGSNFNLNLYSQETILCLP